MSTDSPSAEQRRLFEQLIAEHSRTLLRYTESLLQDRHLAEDVTQETLLRAWQRWERLLANEGSMRAWLLRVARNLAIDRLRSAASRHEIIGADHQDLLVPDHADSVLTTSQIVSLLRPLSREHQEVLMHIYLLGRTVPDTARVLGIREGTVKSRQHYALVRLASRS